MVLATSRGFRGAYLTSRHRLSMSAIAGEGTAMERDYDYSSTLHAADLDAAERIGRSAGERAVERLNPRKVATKRVPVVFDKRIAGGLIGHLAGAINGSAVARKTSFLKDKLGERLFKPGIRIVDDPLRKRGLRSRPFDGEGVAARPLALVEDGVLKSWLLDCATARELSLTTTGHAQRGVSSPPSPGASNLHLEPGSQTPDELLQHPHAHDVHEIAAEENGDREGKERRAEHQPHLFVGDVKGRAHRAGVARGVREGRHAGASSELRAEGVEAGGEGFAGALFDFGLSSAQIDDPTRGMSFMHDGPLDLAAVNLEVGPLVQLLRGRPHDPVEALGQAEHQRRHIACHIF
jgi:hypothetical protein